MDILFVIDNSESMQDEQDNLGKNFPRFIDALNQLKLDWRVGVTSTGKDTQFFFVQPLGKIPGMEKGENGNLQQKCGMTQRWIDRYDNVDVAQQFACLANLGTMGSGMEMPLEGMRLALVDRMADGSNAGFLRADALLAIVFLTDENDCSHIKDGYTLDNWLALCVDGQTDPPSEPVSMYANVLDQVAKGHGRWAAAAIAGPGPGVCTSQYGNAEEATRLKELIQLAGANGVFSSICTGDLAQPLGDAISTFISACQSFPPIM